MKDQRVIVHELSGLPLTPEGYAMRTQCGRAVYDDINAVWWDDSDRRHGLPKRDKFGPHGYRWCRRCQIATMTYGHEPKSDKGRKENG